MIIFIPFFLIVSQPDLGTSLIVLLLGMFIMFFVGVRIWKFFLALFITLASFPLISKITRQLDMFQKKWTKVQHGTTDMSNTEYVKLWEAQSTKERCLHAFHSICACYLLCSLSCYAYIDSMGVPSVSAAGDVGIAAGSGRAVIFRKGKKSKIVDEKDMLKTLMDEIYKVERELADPN